MDDEELSEPEITNDEVLQPKDSFLNIPGLRSLYRDYPPVPYPLSYAGIPVKKRSVNMNSNSMPNEFVDSAQDVTNEKKTYRIKRDLHDEDDFEDEQFLPESLYYLPKRFDDFNDRENEYYPSSPYGNLEVELRLQEEAILEEVEERQQRELERKKAKQLEKFLFEKELQSEAYPDTAPEFPIRDNENYEVLIHNGKIGIFIPIEDEEKEANPKYSVFDQEVSKREFYPIDGDRRWDNFIRSEMVKRNERNAYNRILELAESLRKRQF